MTMDITPATTANLLRATGAGTVDTDPDETREWLEALEAVVQVAGHDRAIALLRLLEEQAQQRGIVANVPPYSAYRNTIPAEHEGPYPGDLAVEELQHLEAVQLRHLDVEEEDVRGEFAHRFHRFEAVGALADDLEVRVGGEQLAQHAARQLLVVDNERADAGRAHGTAASGSAAHGSEISARKRVPFSAVRSQARVP